MQTTQKRKMKYFTFFSSSDPLATTKWKKKCLRALRMLFYGYSTEFVLCAAHKYFALRRPDENVRNNDMEYSNGMECAITMCACACAYTAQIHSSSKFAMMMSSLYIEDERRAHRSPYDFQEIIWFDIRRYAGWFGSFIVKSLSLQIVSINRKSVSIWKPPPPIPSTRCQQ